jgi:uncharacterized membrane protein
MTFKSLRRTILTGAVLLLPLVALLYFMVQVFLVGVKVATPVIGLLGIERAAGFLLANLAGLALVLGLCLLAGLAARLPAVTDRMKRLDHTLERRIPGYSMLVGALRGAAGDETAVDRLRTVLVTTDGGRRLGFEVERAGDRVVVFLPNAPHPQSGVAMLFAAADVEPLDLTALRLYEILQFHGKGMAALPAGPGDAQAPPPAPALTA